MGWSPTWKIRESGALAQRCEPFLKSARVAHDIDNWAARRSLPSIPGTYVSTVHYCRDTPGKHHASQTPSFKNSARSLWSCIYFSGGLPQMEKNDEIWGSFRCQSDEFLIFDMARMQNTNNSTWKSHFIFPIEFTPHQVVQYSLMLLSSHSRRSSLYDDTQLSVPVPGVEVVVSLMVLWSTYYGVEGKHNWLTVGFRSDPHANSIRQYLERSAAYESM